MAPPPIAAHTMPPAMAQLGGSRRGMYTDGGPPPSPRFPGQGYYDGTPPADSSSRHFFIKSNQPTFDEDHMVKEVQNIFNRICKDGGDAMSRLQFFTALTTDATVRTFLLPGHDKQTLMENEDGYEAAHHLFNDIARGRQRVHFKVFVEHFRHSKAGASNANELRAVFDKLDTNRNNQISRYELMYTVKTDPAVAKLILHDWDMEEGEEELSEAVDRVFQSIAGDWNSFDFADFVAYFRGTKTASLQTNFRNIDRRQVRVLIVGPGFGAKINPLQTQVVANAGFQLSWVHDVPNPEEAQFDFLPHVSRIARAIQENQPDLVMAGSKGGAYCVALWQMGYWRGPTVLINAHPTCNQLLPDVPIVICAGDQDQTYPRPRHELEAMIQTGTPNKCFLYYSTSSGQLASGHTPRVGDQHNMATICQFDTLPRLMEAALQPQPEVAIMKSWRDRLTPQRSEAEGLLGHTPQKFRQYWVGFKREHLRNQDSQFLYTVQPQTTEFRLVSTIFLSGSIDPSTYGFNQAQWERCQIFQIQRVENPTQEENGTRPYFDTVKKSCARMGVEFIPSVHTRWLFHGSNAIDSILSNPVHGFQPLTSGSAGAAVWGRGTYFARDAGYVASGPFCGQPQPDGTRRMLLCYVTTGMSCAGSPQHTGILPIRQEPHRYNSTVDSLASPEVFIIQHPGAAYPAYVITFRGL